MTDEELPDTALLWRWVGVAARPVVGWLLVAAGVVAITAGWFGVSREALVARQLPYLVSGGIGGMALVFLGGVLVGASDLWRTAARLDRLERQVGDLHRLLLQEAATGEAGTPAGTRSPRGERTAGAPAEPVR